MKDVNSNDLFDENKVTADKPAEETGVETSAAESTGAAETAENTEAPVTSGAEPAGATEQGTTPAATETPETTAAPEYQDPRMAEIERLAAEKFGHEKKSFEYTKEVNIDNKWLNIAGMIAILLMVGAVIIYLMPSKRVARLITKADELYIAEDYANAGRTYEKALMIDALNAEAAKGFVSSSMADSEADAGENLKKVINGLETIKARNGELKTDEEEVSAWVDVFLLSPEIFRAREDAEILTEGYELFNEPSELKPALANAYYEWGEDAVYSDVDEALAGFDKALLYSDNADSYKKEVKEKVTSIIESLKISDNYAKAYEVLNKYKGTLYADDFADVKASIAASEEVYAVKTELLSQVYDTIAPYYESVKGTPLKDRVKDDTPLFGFMGENWETMLMIDGSENADKIAFSFAADSYIYAKEGFSDTFTGVGCGLYTYGDRYTREDGSESISYYFYFGEYKNGQRDGYGIMFVKADVSSYFAFEGEWKDDAPNGFGASYECDMYSYTSLAAYRRATYGEYKNGYENGDMVSIVLLNEHPTTYFKGSYKAENGYVAPVEGDLINYGIVDPVPEGYKLIAVLASATAGYDYIIPIYIPVDSLLGTVGR